MLPALVITVLLASSQIQAQTIDPNVSTPPSTTEPPTTTAEATTVTTTVTVTTAGPTTTTESPTTTPETTTVDATTTVTNVPVKTYCGLKLDYGAAQNDLELSGTDDTCAPVLTTDYSVPFFSTQAKKFYVCTNGVFCFKHRYLGYSAPTAGTTDTKLNDVYCLAPYFTDLNTLTTGKIWYQIYDTAANPVLTSDDAVTTAEGLVFSRYDKQFDAVLVIKATWTEVPGFDGDAAKAVTFQMIFTSNGVESYTFYNYEQGGMNRDSGQQLIGYINNGNVIGIADSSEGSYLRNPDENLKFGTCYGATSFQLFSQPLQSNAELSCILWHNSEVANKQTYINTLNDMPGCPCTSTLANWNPKFQTLDFWSGASTVLVAYSVPTAAIPQHSRSCAYNSETGSLISSGPNVGSFLTYYPIDFYLQYQRYDARYKDICCVQSDMCNLFYDVRPQANQCTDSSNVRFASGFGDPHIITLDGKTYTFNGLGEYVLFRVPDSSIEIQSRTGQAIFAATGDVTDATIYTGFAVNTNTGWFQVEINSSRGGINLYAGASKSNFIDYTRASNEQGDAFAVTVEGINIQRFGQTFQTKFINQGIVFNVTVGQGLLLMRTGVFTDAYNGVTKGLLGNFNRNAEDDFIPRGGATSLNAPDDETIFTAFGQTWMTTAQESVFFYDPGKTHASYSFPLFTPKFVDQANQTLVAEAEAKCPSQDFACIFDYVFTGNEDVALETAGTQTTQAKDTQILKNEVPVLSLDSGTNTVQGNNYLNIALNDPTDVTLSAVDDGTVTYELVDTSSNIATVSTNQDGTGKITVSLDNTKPVNISVVAKDDQNAFSPIIQIIPVVCTGCSDHGTCDYNIFRQTDITGYETAVCVCDAPWEGDDCETNFDGCREGPCSAGTICTDTPAADQVADPNLPAYTCSSCGTGFTTQSNKCIDIDECATGTPCTDGTCVNTPGSYTCQCNSGYRQQSDGVTCTDINECDESTSGCDQLCTNTAGSFTCSCRTGFTLTNNVCVQDTPPSACTGNTCPTVNGGCTDDGNNNAVCFCNTGYQLSAGDTLCEDIDECSLNICSQDCTNTVGSYQCNCFTGFSLDADRVSCNQCEFPSYGVGCASTCQCGQGAERCDPASGCVCYSGWTGTTCDEDINECTVNPDVCGDINKFCTNTIGSYTCTCRSGYQLNDSGGCEGQFAEIL